MLVHIHLHWLIADGLGYSVLWKKDDIISTSRTSHIEAAYVHTQIIPFKVLQEIIDIKLV